MTDWIDQPEAHLDPEIAQNYDRNVADRSTPEVLGPTLDVLEQLADGGKVVEFAIGTGRVALPLAGRGVAVSGMDLSGPMLERLRAKEGAESIEMVHGDMTTTSMGDDFSLAFLVFNTIMNLRTQQAQVECFRNAARHLRPGGRFVLEVGVPGLDRLPGGASIVPFHVSSDRLGFDEYVDKVNQILVSHHYRIEGERVRTSSPSIRYVWPSELDLMAELAGMHLESRWADWDRSPFTDTSDSHVSVWRKRA